MDAVPATTASVEWVSDLAAFRRLGPEWDALVDQVEGATVFQRHEWLCAAFETESDRKPCVGLIWRDARLAAALPLDIGWDRYGGLPLRTARVSGYPRTDRHIFLAEDATLIAPLLDAAMGLPADMVLLAETLESDAVSGVLRSWLEQRGVRALSRRASVARQVKLSASTSDSLYKLYRTKHRTNVRRSRRRLEELGSLDIDILRPEPDVIESLIARLKVVEDGAWQGEQGTGLFSTEDSLVFFARAFAALAAKRDFWVAVMRLDGDDVMYILGLTHGANFYWYSTAFQSGKIKGSAFHVLLHDLMIALRKSGVDCFDSSRNTPGRENALDRLDPQMLEHQHFALFRSTPLGLSQSFAYARALPLFRRMRAMVLPNKGLKINAPWQAEPCGLRLPRVDRCSDGRIGAS